VKKGVLLKNISKKAIRGFGRFHFKNLRFVLPKKFFQTLQTFIAALTDRYDVSAASVHSFSTKILFRNFEKCNMQYQYKNHN